MWYHVSKSNKCETCQQKITILLTNERHILVSSYFYTHVFYLLGFDMIDMVSMDTKYIFSKKNVKMAHL